MKIRPWLKRNAGWGALIAAVVLVMSSLYLSWGEGGEGGKTAKTEGMANMGTGSWHESIDVIYYINLDHREDRRDQFLDEMRRTQVPDAKIVRISGVYKPGQGDWGCSLSHLKAMTQFEASPHRNCVIFEDDFVFQCDTDELNRVFAQWNREAIPYDVCMLSANIGHSEPTPYPGVHRVMDAQTASGYLVNHEYAPALLRNFQEGTGLIGKSYQEQGKREDIQRPFCIDQYWKRLQRTDRWFVFEPKLGIQRPSFSDIQGGFIDSGV